MKKYARMSLALFLAAVLLLGCIPVLDMTAGAQYAAGTAPFINTWLVSGPFDTPVAEELYSKASGTQEIPDHHPTAENLALRARASATSIWQQDGSSYPKSDRPAANALPKFAADGNLNTEWISQMHNYGTPWPAWDPEPTLFMSWDYPVTVERMMLYERHNPAWGPGVSNVSRVDYVLKGVKGETVAQGTVDSFVKDSPNGVEVILPQPAQNVCRAEFKIVHDGKQIGDNVGLGFREVQVFGWEQPSGPRPTDVQISPVQGESMVPEGGKWEYFDDRLWNRTYDDYQDLYGYYTVKKGIDTRNRYVYAHTYVYSPQEQQVQLRFGCSGSVTVFVNDAPVTVPSQLAEVQKDMVIRNIQLNPGWNKILMQIHHVYTDDCNENGYPVAQDHAVAYLGFYGRITDADGNAVKGLEYSVSGDEQALRVVTGGLSAEDVQDDGSMGRGLPENNMPVGYTQWPYVWNKSKYTKGEQHTVSASGFRFMAAGGAPGYTWSLAEGSSLPKGLTLGADGTIDGMIECGPGDYPFTVVVTDSSRTQASKEFTITVRERPNRWFEEGRVSALSHCVPIYQWFLDPNWSADQWAERASRQGHSMVSVETLQQNYYWPSRFADPQHPRNLYMKKDENGQIVDGLKQFEEAVKRHGMKFGMYYATEGGGLRHMSTDVFVQNVEDLILRYDPAYLYFDGPNTMPTANFDVMYSCVRNYSDQIIIQSNFYRDEFGDPDLRTYESIRPYQRHRGSDLTKLTPMELWKPQHTRHSPSDYYSQRDDYRLLCREMVVNAGRGIVDNVDQMPISQRGPNWDSPRVMAEIYPMTEQEFVDLREQMAAWFAPEGHTNRHESIIGTMPYFLNSPCGCKDDGHGNYAHFEEGHGPKWGYATGRDNNLYLHIVSGPDGRIGFRAITDNKLQVAPVRDHVEQVFWLNADQPLPFTQEGETLTVDLTGVAEDQVDTIIKVVTDNPRRTYKLTDLQLDARQISDGQLQILVKGYETYQALRAELETVTYTSLDPEIIQVSPQGVVTAGTRNGTGVIRVTAVSQGATAEKDLKVTCRDGLVYVGENLLGVSLWVDGKEAYSEISQLTDYGVKLTGRSDTGALVGLQGAKITMHSAEVLLDQGDAYSPVKLQDTNLVTFGNGIVTVDSVFARTRIAVWAQVELDGRSFTSNRVYLDVNPQTDLTAQVTGTGTLTGTEPQAVLDGKTMSGVDFDQSRWSASADQASSLTFTLPEQTKVAGVEVYFNTWEQQYCNTPKDMDIQLSTDGTHWTTALTVTPPVGKCDTGFFNPYTFQPQNARYVRLNFPGGSNGGRLDILEVKLHGITEKKLELPKGLEITQLYAPSALDADSTADAAHDRNPDTVWKTRTVQGVYFAPDRNLYLTLDGLQTVSQVQLIPYERDGKTVIVQVALVDSQGRELAFSPLQPGTSGVPMILNFENVENVASLRVFLTEKDGDRTNHLGIAEIEVS